MIRHVVGVISIQTVKECVKSALSKAMSWDGFPAWTEALPTHPWTGCQLATTNRRLRSINGGGSLGQEISKETGNEAS